MAPCGSWSGAAPPSASAADVTSQRVGRAEQADEGGAQEHGQQRPAQGGPAGAGTPERGEEHHHRAKQQLEEGVHQEERRRHERRRERHHQEAGDAKADEERDRGEEAQRAPAPRARIGEDGRQVDRDERRGDALLGDREAAPGRPQHVGRGAGLGAEDVEHRRRRAGDEGGHREDAGALEVQRRGGGEEQEEGRRENHEAAGEARRGSTRRPAPRLRARDSRRWLRTPSPPSATRIHANT